MKLLFVSNLFPDADDPVRGLDNACLLHALSDRVEEIRAIGIRPTLGKKREYEAREEDRKFSPRYCCPFYIPKVGSRWNHRLMARSLRQTIREIRSEFPFDVVLGSWLYPDGCALAQLAREMDFRYLLICQGSDARAYLDIPVRRKLIVDAARGSGGVITRSADLARRLREAGVSSEKLHPIYNGVDTSVFRPASDSAKERAALGLDAEADYLVYVGNFLPVKNPMRLLDAWRQARLELGSQAAPHDLRLVMIGAGPMEGQIRSWAAENGLSEMLTLTGRLAPPEVAGYLRLGRCLVLSSHNEGVPNVVLEALASGVPVVSTEVGGISEIITSEELGTLVPPNNIKALAQALVDCVTGTASREIAQKGAEFSWAETAERYLRLIEDGS